MATVRERGQLVLVAGLALAISLVAIALVLNSAIYTHNLASRYDSPGDGVVRSNHDVRESAGANVQYANEEFAADGYDDIRSNYTDGIPDIEAAIAEDAAIHGRLLRVSHVDGSAVEGVRIVDDEPGGSNFTSRTNESNWTVVKDAQVRGFVIQADADATETNSLTEGTVLGGILGSDAFTVGFDDTGGGDSWRVAIYENGNSGEINATVRNIDTGDSWTCNADGPVVDVDFSAGRIGSESCAPLLFVEELSKPYNISFINSKRISGSYRMVADGVVDGPAVTTGAFTDRVDAANYGAHCGDAAGGTEQSTFYNASANTSEYPRVTPALYETAVDTTYDSDSVTYEGRHRIAPGETGDPPQTPVIRSFEVTDSSGGDGNFTVDWNVTDPNGDSLTVDIVAEDDSGGTTSMTDVGDSGTDELFDLTPGNGPYTFNITATDGTNNRGAVQTHADDGDGEGCPA